MANEYADLDELKSMRQIPLSDTTDDTALTNRIERASRAIDDRTGRRFYLDSTATARVFPVMGRTVVRATGQLLLVDDIGSETDLMIYIGGEYQDLSGISYSPDNAIVRGRPITGLLMTSNSWGTDDVQVYARWGWPSVPSAIVEATLLLANRRWFRKESPEGVAGRGSDGPIQVSRFDPDVEDLVAPFVIPGFGS